MSWARWKLLLHLGAGNSDSEWKCPSGIEVPHFAHLQLCEKCHICRWRKQMWELSLAFIYLHYVPTASCTFVIKSRPTGQVVSLFTVNLNEFEACQISPGPQDGKKSPETGPHRLPALHCHFSYLLCTHAASFAFCFKWLQICSAAALIRSETSPCSINQSIHVHLMHIFVNHAPCAWNSFRQHKYYH